MSNEFRIDAALARNLLHAQGDPASALEKLPDSAFEATMVEAGQRVVAAVADLGYRHQHERTHREEDGHEPGSRMPIARISGEGCAWIDPTLARILAHDFGLDGHRHGKLLGDLLCQFFEHATRSSVSGHFGQVVATRSTGDLSIDLAP